MSDEIDIANDTADFYLSLALSNRPTASGQPSLAECSDCGDAIPQARRLAVPGVALCLSCQSALERKEKGYARD